MNNKPVNDLIVDFEDESRIDAYTTSRLRQAREAALDAYDKKHSGSLLNRWSMPMPAAFASVALMALAFVAVINVKQTESSEYQQIVNEILIDDSIANALVTEEIDMDFYENIEFYDWLNETDQG